MWFDEAVVYQIYPLGLCGVLNEERISDDCVVGHSILEVKDWISHIKKLGATCILFNPLMESDYHGYDTRDYYTVDRHLGTNDDLKEVCDAIHEAGLKILFDGVLIMLAAVSGHLRMCRKRNGTAHIVDGFI